MIDFKTMQKRNIFILKGDNMKFTLVTGAASGLGKEFSYIYAKEGNNLILVDINIAGLTKLKEELLSINKELIIVAIQCDLTKINEIKQLVSKLTSKDIFINTLINAAGFGDRKDFKDMDLDKQIKMIDLNCTCLVYLTKYFLKNMLANKEGHIINISSIAGYMPGPYMSTYHASKAYVLSLGEALSYELQGTGVKLLTLCPGPFTSNFVKVAHNDYTFSKIKPIEAKKVALIGYKKSIKGKSLYIVGFKNKLICFCLRFIPRSLIAKLSAKTMKKGA